MRANFDVQLWNWYTVTGLVLLPSYWNSFVIAFLETSTGKYMSEALILASTNPQSDGSLFIELWVQYMKIPDSEHVKNILRTSWEHVVYINCSECQKTNKKQFVYTTCSQHVLSLEFVCTELVIQWTIFLHIVG